MLLDVRCPVMDCRHSRHTDQNHKCKPLKPETAASAALVETAPFPTAFLKRKTCHAGDKSGSCDSAAAGGGAALLPAPSARLDRRQVKVGTAKVRCASVTLLPALHATWTRWWR